MAMQWLCNGYAMAMQWLWNTQWDPLLNKMGQDGQTFVRDMSLLKSQSKGCVNPTFDTAHKCIFAMCPPDI